MGFVPDSAKWYLAEIVEEIRVVDFASNTVHRNLVLIRADSADEAYEKALRFGREAEIEYDNPNGERVTVRFRGISHLDVIHDALEDGAELSYRSDGGLSEEQIAKLLRPKDALNLFLPQ